MLSVAGGKKNGKNSNPLLKIISTPSPSQFSFKETPREVEVLEACPTHDSSRLSAKEGSQTPSSNVTAAGPSHWSPDHGFTFLLATHNPTAGKRAILEDQRARRSPSGFAQQWSTSHGGLSARHGVICIRDHALKSILSAFPWFAFRFRSPLWSALPITDGFSQHFSNGLFEDKAANPISDKTSPIRFVGPDAILPGLTAPHSSSSKRGTADRYRPLNKIAPLLNRARRSFSSPSAVTAVPAALEEFGWSHTRTFLPDNTSLLPDSAHVNCVWHLKDHPAWAAEHSAMDKNNNCIEQGHAPCQKD